jgi:hypothetical protein
MQAVQMIRAARARAFRKAQRAHKRDVVQAGYHANGLNGPRAVARRAQQRLKIEAGLLEHLRVNAPFAAAVS